MRTKLIGAIATVWASAFLLLGTAAPSYADVTYDWSYTGTGASVTDTGSGTLTVDPATGQITTFSGTWDTFSISSSTNPLTANAFLGNNNLFYGISLPLFDGVGVIDNNGVSFTDSNGDFVNIFFIVPLSSPPYEAITCSDIACEAGSIVTLGDFVANAVPGPIAGAGLPGLIFACGGLLGWWRRKRKQVA